jgi:hypothetical protein
VVPSSGVGGGGPPANNLREAMPNTINTRNKNDFFIMAIDFGLVK